jgi:hypothetical protein
LERVFRIVLIAAQATQQSHDRRSMGVYKCNKLAVIRALRHSYNPYGPA